MAKNIVRTITANGNDVTANPNMTAEIVQALELACQPVSGMFAKKADLIGKLVSKLPDAFTFEITATAEGDTAATISRMTVADVKNLLAIAQRDTLKRKSAHPKGRKSGTKNATADVDLTSLFVTVTAQPAPKPTK